MLTATDDQTRAVLDWFFFERTEEAFCRLFQVMFPKLKRHLLLCGLADDDAEQVAVAFLGSYLPARRAMSLNPVDVLRSE